MIDICSCCNGCSSTRQLSMYPRYSLPKKLLVAIALVVIIAMITAPSEARPQPRRRHKHTVGMALTKESPRHNKPHLEHSRRQITKDKRTPRNTRLQLYSNQYKKIFRKLKNTKSFFKYQREEEMKYYKEKAPSWLPRVNFKLIHFFNYKKQNNGKVSFVTKFNFIMPILYRSLAEYEKLFKIFQSMDLDFPDTPDSYHTRRAEMLRNTSQILDSTIQEVDECLTAVNLTKRPRVNKDFSTLSRKVTMTEALRLDTLLFRGYGTLLNNWISELRCLKKRRPAIQMMCKQWEDKLKGKVGMNTRGWVLRTKPEILAEI